MLKISWEKYASKVYFITLSDGTVYEIGKTFNISSYPTPGNHLFGVVSLNKNDDNGKYKYSGYGIELDRHGFFYILVVELVEM